MSAEIGSLQWARETRGLLGRRERARAFADVTLLQLRTMPEVLSNRFGGRFKGSGPDPSAIVLPDSALAVEALELCQAELDPLTVAHSMRGAIFACALGEAEGLSYDAEEIFLAAMFHDWGFKDIGSLDCCFTLPGAEKAIEMARGAGWEPGRAEAVGEAITGHIDTKPPRHRGTTQYLAHEGIFLDVFSLRSRDLDGAGLRRVFERHPDEGFKPHAVSLFKVHAKAVPCCRIRVALQAGFEVGTRLVPV